jgi:hypothetical protein
MAIMLYQPTEFGDTSGTLGGHAIGAAQNLTKAFTGQNGQIDGTLVGDANALAAHAIGGNDTLALTVFGGGSVIGDAISMSAESHGGDDQIDVLARGSASAAGDAVTLSSNAQGGNDRIYVNASYGPATAYGDADTMSGHAQGGNDTVTGSELHAALQLYGDAQTLSGWAVGGNDTMIAGSNPSNLTQIYGDGAALLDHATGGNDMLISGLNDDEMWGDAATVARTAITGADTFVFSPTNGHDTIEDFQPGQDHIELKGYADITNIAQLMPYVTDTTTGALITFDANDSILVLNDQNLTSGDFIFT